MPELPDGEENTGFWKRNTGETIQFLTDKADKSYAYRVTYTNINGIESEQLFTLAVQGDCLPTRGIQSIYKNNDTYIGNNTVEVVSGDSISLELKVDDFFGTILWSTGEAEYKINIPCISSSRNIIAVFKNQYGSQNNFIYKIIVSE
jgi:hypothetical protein